MRTSSRVPVNPHTRHRCLPSGAWLFLACESSWCHLDGSVFVLQRTIRQTSAHRRPAAQNSREGVRATLFDRSYPAPEASERDHSRRCTVLVVPCISSSSDLSYLLRQAKFFSLTICVMSWRIHGRTHAPTPKPVRTLQRLPSFFSDPTRSQWRTASCQSTVHSEVIRVDVQAVSLSLPRQTSVCISWRILNFPLNSPHVSLAGARHVACQTSSGILTVGSSLTAVLVQDKRRVSGLRQEEEEEAQKRVTDCHENG